MNAAYDERALVWLGSLQGPLLWIAVAGVLTALIGGRAAAARLASPFERRVLWGLRVAAVLLMVAVLAEPAIQHRRVVKEKTNVAVLVDDSRSMALPAGGGDERRRAAAVSQWIGTRATLFDTLEREHVVRWYRVGEGLTPAARKDIAAGYEPAGRVSAIAESLDEIRRSLPPDELAGILLFSDGVNTGPMPDAPADARLVPVDVFAPAGGEAPVDAAVDDLVFDDFAFVLNTVTVRATILSRGFDGREVPVTLTQAGAPVAAKSVVLKDGAGVPVELSFKPARLGRFVYELSIPLLAGESVETNNARRFVIKVIRDRVRVVHVVGRPDPDMRFTRELLKTNPNVDLISFFILRTRDDSVMVSERELSLIPFPAEELFQTELHTFDVVIFQNFDFIEYQVAPYLGNIARFVRDGGGFLMIGGDLSFVQGGYAGTPIEEILPVTLGAGGAVASGDSFTPELTAEGVNHPVTALEPDEEANRKAWAALAPLAGLNLGLSPRPDAVVLARHPRLKAGGEGAPVIAVRSVDKGRSAVFAADSSWRWVMQAVREGRAPTEYNRFWNGTLRWLMKDPELQHIRVIPARDDVRPGEPAAGNVRVLDASFLPARKKVVRIKATGADGAVLFSEDTATDDGGVAPFRFSAPATEGEITITAETEIAPGRTERDAVTVLVTGSDREWADVRVDETNLREIAAESGGAYFTLGDAPDYDDLSVRAPTIARVVGKRDEPLWDNAYAVLLLVGVLALEWWWRTRRRLA